MRTAGTSRTPRTWRTGRRRTGSVPILAAVLVLVPLAAACGEEQADGRRPGSASVSAEPPLTGVRWAVDSVTVDGATRRSPGSARLTIADGKASGSYGCNDFTATAVVEGGSVRFGDARTTRMACAGPVMAFERLLAGALADGLLTTEVKGDTLTLGTAGGDLVRLTRT
ncbi:META domain-containing protein [Streptomyces sp. NBC_00704]|uniref:META domain-containing protein n=1 Tax=Streptomyces sp. NBC_00704 TaxID=2975809 RepID=UPI002E373DC9|nr:META domain-containing protein [Streptomyces sp. NBC_00704]